MVSKILSVFILAITIFFSSACSTKGYANSNGGVGYTEWRLNF